MPCNNIGSKGEYNGNFGGKIMSFVLFLNWKCILSHRICLTKAKISTERSGLDIHNVFESY